MNIKTKINARMMAVIAVLAVLFTAGSTVAYFTDYENVSNNFTVPYRYRTHDAGQSFQNGVRRYIMPHVRFCIRHRPAHHRSGSFQRRR